MRPDQDSMPVVSAVSATQSTLPAPGGLTGIRALPSRALIGLVRAYQVTISPLTGPRCKYYPSCSRYAVEALRMHGALRGLRLAAWRLLRCNPWSDGGVDDVPQRGARTTRSLHNTNQPTLSPVEP
jgi:putative membrane protein insertion efficiency factor